MMNNEREITKGEKAEFLIPLIALIPIDCYMIPNDSQWFPMIPIDSPLIPHDS